MNLKETKSLLDNKILEVKSLIRKRNDCLLDEYRFVQGTDIAFEDKFKINSPHEFTVDELTTLIDSLDTEILQLKHTLNKANEETTIVFHSETMSLSTAIFKVKTMRDKLPSLKKLGEIKEDREVVTPSRYSEDTQTYVRINKPTYDFKKYRELGKALENDIIELQSIIDKANVDTYV